MLELESTLCDLKEALAGVSCPCKGYDRKLRYSHRRRPAGKDQSGLRSPHPNSRRSASIGDVRFCSPIYSFSLPARHDKELADCGSAGPV